MIVIPRNEEAVAKVLLFGEAGFQQQLPHEAEPPFTTLRAVTILSSTTPQLSLQPGQG